MFIVNDSIKPSVLSVLNHPDDSKKLERLIATIQKTDPGLGSTLSQFTSTGKSEEGFIYADKSKFTPQWQISRLLDDASIIRFACGCAEYFLPLIQDEFPRKREVHELLNAMHLYLEKRASSKELASALERVQQLASHLDRNWDEAFREGEFDEYTANEIRERYLPLVGVEQALSTGRMATASSRDEILSILDDLIFRFLEHAEGNARPARKWQLLWLSRYLTQ